MTKETSKTLEIYMGKHLTDDILRISAKNLGELALSDFCPRCFWLRLKVENHLPFQIFPGIFSSIDAYTKRVVHSWMDANRGAPFGLDALGEVTGYIDPPHWSHFSMKVSKYNILLTGAPDGILRFSDGTIAIIDYKTAKYTAKQDSLMPMYEVQLNGYAAIAEHQGLGHVSKLALVYSEPVTDEDTAARPEILLDDGFFMPFSVHVHPVVLDLGMLDPLYRQARKIHDLSQPPKATPGCQDCEKLQDLVKLVRDLGK
jgi:hypothetical protein